MQTVANSTTEHVFNLWIFSTDRSYRIFVGFVQMVTQWAFIRCFEITVPNHTHTHTIAQQFIVSTKNFNFRIITNIFKYDPYFKIPTIRARWLLRGLRFETRESRDVCCACKLFRVELTDERGTNRECSTGFASATEKRFVVVAWLRSRGTEREHLRLSWKKCAQRRAESIPLLDGDNQIGLISRNA